MWRVAFLTGDTQHMTKISFFLSLIFCLNIWIFMLSGLLFAHVKRFSVFCIQDIIVSCVGASFKVSVIRGQTIYLKQIKYISLI